MPRRIQMRYFALISKHSVWFLKFLFWLLLVVVFLLHFLFGFLSFLPWWFFVKMLLAECMINAWFFTWCKNCSFPLSWRTCSLVSCCWCHSTSYWTSPKFPSSPTNQCLVFLSRPNSYRSCRCSSLRHQRTCCIQNVYVGFLGKCNLRFLHECCWFCNWRRS